MSNLIEKPELNIKDLLDNEWKCYYAEGEEGVKDYIWELRLAYGAACEVVSDHEGVFVRSTFPVNLDIIEPILEEAYKAFRILDIEHLEGK